MMRARLPRNPRDEVLLVRLTTREHEALVRAPPRRD